MKNLILILIYLSLISCKGENEKFIINKDIKGYIIVAFGENDILTENDRTYKFENKKIFLSNFKKKLGVIDVSAYYDNKGSLETLPFIFWYHKIDYKNIDKDADYLIFISGFSSNNLKEKVSLNLYWVGKLKDFNKDSVVKVVSKIEQNATLENLKNDSLSIFLK